MRWRGFFGCVSSKVLCWGLSARGLAQSEGAGLVGEGVDPAVDAVEVVVGEVPCGVELVPPGAVVALDVSVGFGRFGREFERRDASAPAFGFEAGHELGAAVDPDGLDGEGHAGLELVEGEPGPWPRWGRAGPANLGVVCGGAAPGPGAGPLRDGVAGGEPLDGGPAGVGGDGEGVELDDLAWGAGFASLEQASGVGPGAPGGAGWGPA